MESNYNSDNFERLLRESSDQYRMYPSESVWKNIYRTLHTRRKWFGIGFLLLIVSAGFVTTVMLSDASTNRDIVSRTTTTSGSIKSETSPVQKINTPAAKEVATPLFKEKTTDETKQDLFTPFNLAEDDILSQEVITTPITFIEKEEISVDEIELSKQPIQLPIAEKVAEQNTTATNLTAFEPVFFTVTDEATDQNLFYSISKAPSKPQSSSTTIARFNTYPLSIESVINSYVKRHKKLSFQYYFTPTISYRKLSENKSYLNSMAYNPSNTALYYDVNKVVTHKPDMGVEVGVAARYAINKRMKIRAGLQFNTSRYDIKAYRSATELTTIALNTGSAYTADSVNTLSSYRNFNGYKSDWLHNLYFQIAAPIGIELQLAGDNRIKFGIAGTVQPTYILGDRVYMISTNYKNYAEVPSLVRRWNVNTSFEAFVGYSTGRMNWQIGPQVRYQLQSSFIKEYPVKENLFDFGLKIGVSANR